MKTVRRWLILGGLLSATFAAAAWIKDKPDRADAQIVAEARIRPARAQPPSPSGVSSGPAQINMEKLQARDLGESVHDPFATQRPPSGKRNRATALARPAPAVPAPPAAAPPLPFTFMGKLLSGPEAKVFLALGDRNLVLREGDTVDAMYRVEKITDSAITLVYLPLDERQTIVTGESP